MSVYITVRFSDQTEETIKLRDDGKWGWRLTVRDGVPLLILRQDQGVRHEVPLQNVLWYTVDTRDNLPHGVPFTGTNEAKICIRKVCCERWAWDPHDGKVAQHVTGEYLIASHDFNTAKAVGCCCVKESERSPGRYFKHETVFRSSSSCWVHGALPSGQDG